MRHEMLRFAASLIAALLLAGCAALLLAGCGSSPRPSTVSAIPAALLSEARPIGRGVRFHSPSTGPAIGSCRRRLGPRTAAHVELFAENRVVLLATGIGTRPPRTFSAGRITRARCYDALVTLDPTGVVLVRRGVRLSLADLFHSWGEPLSRSRLASFPAPRGSRVVVFVDGRRWQGPPADVLLTSGSEIVLEVGPHVPPHRSFTFPPGA
jgi:hypothetical protein